MKIAAVSDVHNRWKELKIVPADLLVVAGDLTADGARHEFEAFLNWLKSVHNSYSAAVVIAGNHDGYFIEKIGHGRDFFRDRIAEILGPGRGGYLEHQSAEVLGVKVFGSPYVNRYCNLGFNRDNEERKELWSEIPEDTELLVTHMPPFGILDGVYEENFVNSRIVKDYVSQGCKALKERLSELTSLKTHVFGHIHEWGGRTVEIDGITFANAAFCSSWRAPEPREIVIFEI